MFKLKIAEVVSTIIKGEMSGLTGMSLPKIHKLWSSIPIGVRFYYNL